MKECLTIDIHNNKTTKFRVYILTYNMDIEYHIAGYFFPYSFLCFYGMGVCVCVFEWCDFVCVI